MSFLNKAKEQANNILNKKEGSPMTNPFLNKNTVNNQTAPKAPAAPTGVPTPATAPNNLPKPGIPKAPGKPGIPPIPGKPGVPPAPKAPSVPTANPFTKKEIALVEEPKAEEIAPVEEIKEEVKVEETTVEVKETVEEAKTEETAVKEEEKENKKEEEKKSTSRKRTSSRKKTTSKENEVNDAPKTAEDETIDIIMNTTELSYAEACQAVRTHFVDPEWEAAKVKFEEIAKNIHITNDMNKAQLHDLLAQVANLRDEVYSAYTETRTLYEHLTDKENGLIERTKRTGSKGSNAEERKLTSTLAVMNYVDGNGNKINLYEVLDETRIRFNYLKGIIETIEFKKAVLLTMLSSLKSN